MATTYTYNDNYVVNSVDAAELEAVEADALIDLGKQGVIDTQYLEKMTLCLVYIELAGRQLESEGMKDKADHYRKEYKRLSQMDNFEDADDGVVAGKVGRA